MESKIPRDVTPEEEAEHKRPSWATNGEGFSPETEFSHRSWARENYKAGDTIIMFWHPLVKDECNRINKEFNHE
jgi:alkyl hydroperoxide reductase subunit AhpC